MRSFLFVPCVVLVAFAAGESRAEAPDFEKDIKPLLEAKCVVCHGSGKEKGGLQLHTREAMLAGGDTDPAIVVGDADHSLLVERLTLDPADDEIMPQETEPLHPHEIDLIRAWIAAGAPWPEGIRLKAQRAPIAEEDRAIPEEGPASVADAAATVDRLLAHENAPRNPPTTEAIDGLAFLRRATIDLIGRIPTLEEIRDFEAASPATRREELIDRLMADPRFADRWTVFYADMMRVRSNATGGSQLLAWLNQQVAHNRPYDEMVSELISANGRAGSNPAVGFVLTDDADPMSLAASVSQVFLGVRLACAQCHDHPFDDWNQREFYEMAGFFGKTMRRQSELTGSVYTTEGKEMRVQWPPEDDHPPSREAVVPKFPFTLASFSPGEEPDYITRFEELRRAADQGGNAEDGAALDSLDDLLDVDAGAKGGSDIDFDVLGDAQKSSAELKVQDDLYGHSELRQELADLVANPRNPYFARAFVNRVWAELNGRGFVEPIDNFTAFQDISHPQTLEYLSREFVASGYDVNQLIRTIVLSDTYRRGKLPTDASLADQQAGERGFTASPLRRMLSEVLYDSVVIAGHLTEQKWRDGENVRMVSRQVRIPIVDDNAEATGDETPQPEPASAATAAAAEPEMAGAMAMSMNGSESMTSAGAGYDLENSIEIDFAKVLSDAADQEAEADRMRQMADAELERQRMMAEMARQQQERRPPMRYTLKTIEEKVDDNPSYGSSMRMASPAPADHFLRVFGQPSRLSLGEFRDHSASLRQQLMMLNGKITHEAARVGSLEPLHAMLADPATAKIDEAIRLAYLQCLTREPSEEELADARAVLGAERPLEGMSDLRWALLNCHEFRFLP